MLSVVHLESRMLETMNIVRENCWLTAITFKSLRMDGGLQ
jgi:hypothetical protein